MYVYDRSERNELHGGSVVYTLGNTLMVEEQEKMSETDVMYQDENEENHSWSLGHILPISKVNDFDSDGNPNGNGNGSANTSCPWMIAGNMEQQIDQ